ncbi:MAG: LacI family DNA-binding transcriptional regulator [Omnitrophica WOR_2 bacterium]
MEPDHRPATLHDVARLAQVSYQTVSRVINKSPNVSRETRARVIQAIEALNYHPNRAARSLITGRSQTLHLISFNPNFYQPVRFLMQEAQSLGYQLGLSALCDPFSSGELRAKLQELAASQVDGALLFWPECETDINELNRTFRGIPVVQIGGNPGSLVPSVVFNQHHGAQLVVNHLLELGHRQIAEISGPFATYDGRIRHKIYQEMLQNQGLKPGPFVISDFSVTGGYQAAMKLIKSREDFTALMCGNDQIALGALRALHECNLHVPDDVSVVGFDDDPHSEYYEPPLTTIRQDYEAQSRQGIHYLVSLIDHPETPRSQQVIYPQLITRKSTKAI